MEIQNKFQVEDKVKIKISGRIGVIDSIGVGDKNGERLRYWVDYSVEGGKVEGKWFDDYQLEKLEKVE